MRYFSATFFYIMISAGYLMAAGSDSSGSSGSSSDGGGGSYSSDSSEGPDDKPDQFRAVKALIYKEKYVEAYEILATLVVKKMRMTGKTYSGLQPENQATTKRPQSIMRRR